MTTNNPKQSNTTISLESESKKNLDFNQVGIHQCLYQNMSDAVIVYDYENERILDCNPSALKMFSYTKSEFIQLNRFDLIPQHSSFAPDIDVHEHIRKEHSTKVYKGESFLSYVDLISKKGKVLIGKINIIPMHKNSYKAFVIIHNITRAVKQERALIKNEKKHLILLNNTQEAIIYFSLKTRKLIDCNVKVCNIFGTKTKEDFLNTSIYNYYTDGLTEGISAQDFLYHVAERTVNKGLYDFVCQPCRLNGDSFIAEVRSVYDDSEKDHPKIIVFIRDITKQYEALQEKNRLFNEQKQILNSIPAPFVFKDLDNNILACNKALSTAFGVESPKEMIGKNLKEWLCKEEFQLTTEEDNSIINTSQASYNKIRSYQNMTGQNQWYKNDKTPFLDENGNITGILSFIFNVTELINKNKRLKQYIESNTQLENFASIASHDLQAPLRTIHGYTQLLKKKLGENIDAEAEEYMKFILSATGNMRHLIRDLRSYSQVDSTKLNLSKFCMKRMSQEITSELRSSIEDSNAKIYYPQNLPCVIGDRIKIKQLFQNLLANALKYIPESGTPEIHISYEDQPEHWYVEIRDNGIGIAQANQLKIFELFHRLHGNNQYIGTGIGLSLCKKVVEQHQGKIGVRSIPGEGSTFYFSIAKRIKTFDEMMR